MIPILDCVRAYCTWRDLRRASGSFRRVRTRSDRLIIHWTQMNADLQDLMKNRNESRIVAGRADRLPANLLRLLGAFGFCSH